MAGCQDVVDGKASEGKDITLVYEGDESSHNPDRCISNSCRQRHAAGSAFVLLLLTFAFHAKQLHLLSSYSSSLRYNMKS